jgi:hypothetical protein
LPLAGQVADWLAGWKLHQSIETIGDDKKSKIALNLAEENFWWRRWSGSISSSSALLP